MVKKTAKAKAPKADSKDVIGSVPQSGHEDDFDGDGGNTGSPVSVPGHDLPNKPKAGAMAPKPRVVRERKVRAIALGYYGEKRRRVDDVFVLADGAREFSKTWMEDVDPGTRERITTGAQDLLRQHAEILSLKSPAQIESEI